MSMMVKEKKNCTFIFFFNIPSDWCPFDFSVFTSASDQRLNATLCFNHNKHGRFKVEPRRCRCQCDPRVRLCGTSLHITAALLFSGGVNNWPRGVCGGKRCGMTTIILIRETVPGTS